MNRNFNFFDQFKINKISCKYVYAWMFKCVYECLSLHIINC